MDTVTTTGTTAAAINAFFFVKLVSTECADHIVPQDNEKGQGFETVFLPFTEFPLSAEID
jgi:hypothetical protein